MEEEEFGQKDGKNKENMKSRRGKKITNERVHNIVFACDQMPQKIDLECIQIRNKAFPYRKLKT